jgi:hypothetical protein
MGLGGVWSWKSAKKGIGLLPIFNEFVWKGRSVYLVFDSDFATNPDVMRAHLRWQRSCRRRERSRISSVCLTCLSWWRRRRRPALTTTWCTRARVHSTELVSEAVPFSTSQELWQLNSEVVYIRDPGLMIVLEDGRKLSPAAFKEHAYSNRHYYETKVDAKGGQSIVKKPVAPAWLQWECRAELARITYKPGKTRITAEGEYNYWPGWACEPKKGDISLWKHAAGLHFCQRLRQLVSGSRRWCAFRFSTQVQSFTLPLLWGRTHGTGKSLVGYSLGKVYGRNFTEISDEDLSGSLQRVGGEQAVRDGRRRDRRRVQEAARWSC